MITRGLESIPTRLESEYPPPPPLQIVDNPLSAPDFKKFVSSHFTNLEISF